MNIDPPDTPAKETFSLNESKELALVDHRGLRKRRQEGEHLDSVAEVSAGELANCERMDSDDPELQLFPEARFTFA